MDRKEIKVIIESDLKNVFLISTVIGKLCSLAPFSSIEAFQLELCVAEAVNNTIKHAYNNEPNHQVEITFTLDPNRLTFEICDTGRAMDAKYLAQKGTPSFIFDPDDLANLPEGGMGLSIISEIMDEVLYVTAGGRNKLILIKLLHANGSKR
jgi:serine/threonine-protein kinase RsbW